MSSSFRLVRDRITEPALHYALEEAMLRLADSDPGYPPTLRLRRVQPSVLIGYAECAADTVNLEEASRLGVPVVRRHNLGGTVYQDPRSFMFTVLYRRGVFLGRSSDEEVYARFAALVCDFLRRFGVEGSMRGGNDVVVAGRKIYGSSHTRLGEAESHTGTLLIGTDIGRLARLLRFVPEKFSDKGFTSLEEALTTLSAECGRHVPIREAYAVFAACFRRQFGVDLRPSRLTAIELREAKRLRQLKYGRPEWTFAPLPDYEELQSLKVASGLLTVRGRLRGAIEEIAIGGDVRVADRDALHALSGRLRGATYQEACAIVARSSLPSDVRHGLLVLLGRLQGATGQSRSAALDGVAPAVGGEDQSVDQGVREQSGG